MNLTIFSPYYPPHRGGLETHSDEFNKYLSLLGVKITVFTPKLPLTALEKELIHQDVSVRRYPAFELIHNYPIPCFWQKDFWRLWKDLSQESPDLIISRTRFFLPSLMAGYFAWKKALPWVHIEHGSDFAHFGHSFKNFLGKVYDHTLGRLVLRKADFLIANSEASKKFVTQLSGRLDCEIFYRGIEKKSVEEAIPNYALKEKYPDAVHIGYIGRLIRGKGVHDLIRSFALVDDVDTFLIILGDGPAKKSLEDLARKLNITSRIIFLGAQPLPIAMGYLKTWDIFVNPSYTEGIPTSVVEAALLKKAIIATDVGGTKEIISGNKDGILIRPGDPEFLASSLKILIENPELRESMGTKAALSVASRFSWDQTAPRYQSFFENIINAPKS